MDLIIDTRGQVQFVYAETLDLSTLGRLTIVRASHVEPDAAGRWWADLWPVDGPKLGPFDVRSKALETEKAWLDRALTSEALRLNRSVHQLRGSCHHEKEEEARQADQGPVPGSPEAD